MQYVVTHFASLAVLALVALPLTAQFPGGGYPSGGQYPGSTYPGGTYPGGRNPGGGGVGMPFPRRGKDKSTTTSESTQPTKTLIGVLRTIDEKQATLLAADRRILTVKLSSKTAFSRQGKDSSASACKPGDPVTVTATQDQEGFYYALRVEVEKSAADAPTGTARGTEGDDERPILRRKSPATAESERAAQATPPAEPAAEPIEVDQPAEPAAEAVPSTLTGDANTSKEPLTSADESDPGRPVLTRGKTAKRIKTSPAERAPQTTMARNTPPRETVGTRPIDEPSATSEATPEVAGDPRLAKARQAAAEFTDSLPNYVCQEQIARFSGTAKPVNWRPLDVISVNLVYENRREQYRDMKINGKPVKKAMEELSGAWSTGEFGTTVADLFSPGTAANFKFRQTSRMAGREAWLYDFSVDHEHSHWTVQVPAESIKPAYRGSIWLDKETGKTLRIEMQATQLPKEFPLDSAESAIDYEFVRIGEGQFLLPVHAENLSCIRGQNACSRNVIDFRNYHKYTGESSITFEK